MALIEAACSLCALDRAVPTCCASIACLGTGSVKDGWVFFVKKKSDTPTKVRIDVLHQHMHT